MNLGSYLNEKNIQHKDFAKTIGVSKTYISLVINKKRNPSLRVARLIIKETKGKVNVADLFKQNSQLRLIIEENMNETKKIQRG